MMTEFKKFLMRGNVIDMAVGIIVGASFGGIVNSLVNDVLMPPLGLLMGKVDFSNLFLVLQAGGSAAGPYDTLAAAKEAGAVTVNYGLFINTVINFLIVAMAIFVVVRAFNRLEAGFNAAPPPPAGEPTTRDCPYCLTTIPRKATRCPHCTSEIKGK